ncbi:hypothetical protein STBHUCCB_38850 [Salmonella enterica subsp. enterica serovar Typhi str. P-stx-12]|nr:hypothetical protein STBHUCCB_38850 [Salmonella enterica subsp. enterica serovar Typhi str. P-stx-12]AXR56554.1 hypothetical protein CJP42_0043 [Salmonella enterica subsp. enterica serovar Typhi]
MDSRSSFAMMISGSPNDAFHIASYQDIKQYAEGIRGK